MCKEFGGKVILTNKNHENGTSRCLEAVKIYVEETGKEFKHIINIQGDEPLIHEDHLKKLILCFEDSRQILLLSLFNYRIKKTLPRKSILSKRYK